MSFNDISVEDESALVAFHLSAAHDLYIDGCQIKNITLDRFRPDLKQDRGAAIKPRRRSHLVQESSHSR